MNPSRFILGSSLVLATFALGACQQQKATQQPGDTAATASAETGPDAKPGLSVREGVLVLPVVKGNPGAAYFVVTNASDKATTLAAVSVDGVGKTEMHETRGDSMEPVASVALAPGQTATFARGGSHLMLFDIADSLAPGGTVEMTLTFEGGDKLSAPLKVEAAGGMTGMNHGDMH